MKSEYWNTVGKIFIASAMMFLLLIVLIAGWTGSVRKENEALRTEINNLHMEVMVLGGIIAAKDQAKGERK